VLDFFGEGRRLSPQTSPDPERRQRSGLALAGTIGGYVAFCILAGLGLGVAVDHVAHTAPLFLISGVVVGFLLSFVLMYKLAMRELGD
jgi:F0F1-type ATP synthase assembly protein I